MRQIPMERLAEQVKRLELTTRRRELRLEDSYYRATAQMLEAAVPNEITMARIRAESAVSDSMRRELTFQENWRREAGIKDGTDYSEEEHRQMQTIAYMLFKTNPWARSIVDSFMRYVFGQAGRISISIGEKTIEKRWERWTEKENWGNRIKEWGRRTWRDGESLLRRLRGGPNGPQHRFINSLLVCDPRTGEARDTFGIKTKSDDVETVEAYHVVSEKDNGTEIQGSPLSADDVTHIKIGVDSEVKRGVTIMEPVLRYLPQIGQLLDYRLAMHKIRTAYAEVRKVKGGPSALAAIKQARQKQLGDTTDETRTQVPRPGSTSWETEGVDVEFRTPNFQASDAQTDIRYFLLSLCAGTGLAEFMITGDASNANLASTMVAEGPAVRAIQDWQDFFRVPLIREVRWVIGELTDSKETAEVPIDVTFAPIIHRDFPNESKAWVLLNAGGIASRATARARLGIPEDDEERIEAEGGPGMFPQAPELAKPETPITADDATGRASQRLDQGVRDKEPESGRVR